MDRRNLLRTGVAAAAGAGLVGASATTASATTASANTAAATATAPAAPRPPRQPLRVHTVLYDGVEEQDFAGHIEVFGTAGTDRITQSFVTADGPRSVKTSAGMELVCRTPWAPHTADLILVPGAGYGEGSGLDREIRRGVLPRALAAARRRGLVLGAVCSGTMLLSAAGITAGRPCTTHHIAIEDLKAQGGRVVSGRVVDDGDLVTCGGVTSGIDLGLWLLERFFGPETALFAEQVLEYERRGTVWRA
ncbi:DJ-1/PfpI family protein [Streptomyces bambusae]|uniref:DJ-1/PfpI family protein n=1 Tax=Streptomyces bambusae TaxID=1550616 RepID=A0ABS6ZDG0_9ACTN|nr:DJ-1/PfpI family protein [Streptomyces bambusae]MBW5484776.1 DJ-1/PfpI family protein [Streptomyces bambusae]